MIQGKKTSKRCFIVEGNMGVGKSTFLNFISQRLDCDVVFEPHEKWQNIGTSGNLLEKFYQDTPRWAYTFQSYAFLSRVLEQERQVTASSSESLVFERSVFSDLHCFAKNCFEMGTMDSLEWELYQEWFSWLIGHHVIIPSGFIYLRAEPQVCLERMIKRNRKEEVNVPLSYLNLLHQKHEDWLVNGECIADCLSTVPVLILDRNVDWNDDKAEKERLIEKVSDFCKIGYSPLVQRMGKSSSLSL